MICRTSAELSFKHIDLLQDYSPATLTNWGYNEIAGVPQIAGRGVMYKLLMRAFPGYYRGNSVYALFPFTVPEENRKILKDLGQEKDYDYGKPFLIDSPKPVVTWSGVTSVLKNQKDFKTPCKSVLDSNPHCGRRESPTLF